MPREYRNWTEQDNILLAKLWEQRATLTIDAMAAALDCNPKAIHRKANELGLIHKRCRASDIWTPAKIQLLCDMWPNHSAREIAAALGTTRNAVLGRKHRMGLDHKGMARTPEYLEKLNAMRREKARLAKATLRKKHKVFNRPIMGTGKAISLPVLPPEVPISPEAPQGEPVRLVELKPETCRWIVGRSDTDKLATFCPGHRVAPNLPYCSYHHNISYNVQARRGRAS